MVVVPLLLSTGPTISKVKHFWLWEQWLEGKV
jgi:hypothetical protein